MGSILKKKIFFVLPVFQCGGVERVFINMIRFLDKEKYTPFLVVLDTSGLYKEWLPKDVPAYFLKKQKRFDFFKLIYHLAFNIFTEGRPDLVIGFAEYANFISLLAAKLYRKNLPIILTEHNVSSVALKHTRLNGLKKLFIRFMYPKANKIIPVSHQIKNNLTEHFSIPKEKLTVIYNPIDFSRIRYLRKKPITACQSIKTSVPIITACGRLTEQKNYPLLLHAFAEVLQHHPARLVILGDGEKKESLLQLAEQLEITQHINFLGIQDNPFKFLAKSAIYVLSSSWEGFPNSLIEAMACGVASISTRCPSGIEEIITDGVDGLLVPMDDKASMAKAIRILLSDQMLREKIADAGRRRVESLEITKIIQLYEKEFETIFAQTP